MAYVSSDELPKKFDVIVYGTGLTESIIAAALSRNGVSVLHLDANQFYGGESASLMYREFMEFLEEIPATRSANVENVQSEYSTDTQRYFLQSSFSKLYDNVEQEFVEQPIEPEPTVATEQLTDVASKQGNTGEVSSANYTEVGTQEDIADSIQPVTDITQVTEENSTTAATQETNTPAKNGNTDLDAQPVTDITQVTEENSTTAATQETNTPANNGNTVLDAQPVTDITQVTAENSTTAATQETNTPANNGNTVLDAQPVTDITQVTEENNTTAATQETNTPAKNGNTVLDAQPVTDITQVTEENNTTAATQETNTPANNGNTVLDAQPVSDITQVTEENYTTAVTPAEDEGTAHSTQPDTTVTKEIENNSTQESNPPIPDTDTKPYVPSPPSPPKPSTDPVLSWTELKSQYRTFTFDLFPKLIYATDPFVDMIVKSSVTKYLEFKAVNKIITVLDGRLTVVPASRADVFTSKTVSVLEKRLLMRFVTFVMELDKHTDETQQYNPRPFIDFMEHMGLNAKLKSLIKSSIAQVEDDTLTEVALERSQFFLQSIGRYSNSPYLWPVYGIGELPQAFCRMSAVFGGLYMLRKEIRYLELVERDGVKTCSSVCDGENTTFLCKHVVLAASLLPDTRATARYSRAILVTNRKLLPPGNTDIKSDIGFVAIPTHTLGADQPHTIKVIELCPSSQSCPKGCCLVHITCCSYQNTAKADLLPAVEFLFHTASDASDNPPTPKLLYSLYFNYNSTQVSAGNKCTPADNVHVISSPNLDPSYQQILSEAKSVFDTICPGDLFLPPPPDPEDIIYEPATPEGDGEENGGDSNPSPEERKVTEQTDTD